MQRKLNIFVKKFENVRFFFQGEDKSIGRGENHYKSGHVESFSYADGEIVGLVHAASVTAHTRHVVFLIVFSLQPLTEQLHNKRSNSWHDKSSFKSTSNICVMRGI